MALNSPSQVQALQIASPTPDRLAEPTLPASPTQADKGAQVYWLNCSACHGDRAQGLTDEFRQLYPPEDQNCWNSHCHGNVTYENGFTIPKLVPALIGPGALQKFGTAYNLFGFVKAAMPFQRPGNLSDEEYYQILSFLLRENKLWTAPEGVTASNAKQIQIGPLKTEPISEPVQTTRIAPSISFIIGFVVLALLIGVQRLLSRR